MSESAHCEMDVLIADYLKFKMVEGLRKSTLTDMHGRLCRFSRECGFERVDDINTQAATDFLLRMKSQGRTASTLYLNRKYYQLFCQWLVERGLLENNPIDATPKPRKTRRDVNKRRRALTYEELERLVYVARLRPLAESFRRRTTGLKGCKAPFWKEHRITFDNVADCAEKAKQYLFPLGIRNLERDGRKWALVWSILAHTGMRWGELRALKVRQFHYGKQSYISMEANQTKNGLEAHQPVPVALALDVRSWIKECKLKDSDVLIPGLGEKGGPRFHLDREAAGIERMDKFGRSVDVHALRYSYATFLARNNIQPRVIQKLMRHSTPYLSMMVYMDCSVLDHASAAEGLKPLPSIYDAPQPQAQASEPPTILKAETSAAPASGTLSGLPLEMVSQLVGSMDGEAAKKALLAMLGGSASGG